MKTTYRSTMLPLIIPFLSGCTYCHQIHNGRDELVYNVSIRSQTGSFDHGVIGAGSRNGYCGNIKFKKSSPPRIFWQTEDGTPHEQDVQLSRNPGSRYETHFVISEGGVQAFLYPDGPNRPPPSEFRKFLVEIGVREPKEPDETEQIVSESCQTPDCPRCGGKP